MTLKRQPARVATTVWSSVVVKSTLVLVRCRVACACATVRGSMDAVVRSTEVGGGLPCERVALCNTQESVATCPRRMSLAVTRRGYVAVDTRLQERRGRAGGPPWIGAHAGGYHYVRTHSRHTFYTHTRDLSEAVSACALAAQGVGGGSVASDRGRALS